MVDIVGTTRDIPLYMVPDSERQSAVRLAQTTRLIYNRATKKLRDVYYVEPERLADLQYRIWEEIKTDTPNLRTPLSESEARGLCLLAFRIFMKTVGSTVTNTSLDKRKSTLVPLFLHKEDDAVIVVDIGSALRAGKREYVLGHGPWFQLHVPIPDEIINKWSEQGKPERVIMAINLTHHGHYIHYLPCLADACMKTSKRIIRRASKFYQHLHAHCYWYCKVYKPKEQAECRQQLKMAVDLDLTEEQETYLRECGEGGRRLYNKVLEILKEIFQDTGRLRTREAMNKTFSSLPEYRVIPSNIASRLIGFVYQEFKVFFLKWRQGQRNVQEPQPWGEHDWVIPFQVGPTSKPRVSLKFPRLRNGKAPVIHLPIPDELHGAVITRAVIKRTKDDSFIIVYSYYYSQDKQAA